MADVTMYSTTYCGFCRAAKSLLQKRAIDFEEIDLTGDNDARMKLVEMSGGRTTVPQIFVKGEAIGGYNELRALDKSGKLSEMLHSP